MNNTIQNMLNGGISFQKPQTILADLEPSIAVHIPAGSVHSIGGHVAHMAWWQRQALANIRAGQRQPQAGDEFPKTIPPEEWQTALEDFFLGLEALKELCNDQVLLGQAYLGGQETIADLLLDFALHNAYHLGQIVLLRRLQGVWNQAEAI